MGDSSPRSLIFLKLSDFGYIIGMNYHENIIPLSTQSAPDGDSNSQRPSLVSLERIEEDRLYLIQQRFLDAKSRENAHMVRELKAHFDESIASLVKTEIQKALIRKESPFMSPEEAVIFLHLSSISGFYRWASKNRIRCVREGCWPRTQILSAADREIRAHRRLPQNKRGAHLRKNSA